MKRDIETCKSVLYKYLKDNPTWHKKVALYSIAEDWSPETVGRELRLMANPKDGTTPLIFVDTYKGRFGQSLDMYSINQKELPKVRRTEIIDLPDGRRVARIINE